MIETTSLPSNAATADGARIDVQLLINGRSVAAVVEARTLLVEFIREVAGETGTHVGCDTSQCGACTVNLDGLAVKSCTILAAQAGGGVITTVEGLASQAAASGLHMHPVQKAFVTCHGLQCGFCTPGMIMTVERFLAAQPALDEESVCRALEGNICRCTGYVNIIEAVRHAARDMAGARE